MTTTIQVTGLTCGHCASAVHDELQEVPGVSGVDVALVAGGTSTVTIESAEPLTTEILQGALAEAGDYTIVG